MRVTKAATLLLIALVLSACGDKGEKGGGEYHGVTQADLYKWKTKLVGRWENEDAFYDFKEDGNLLTGKIDGWYPEENTFKITGVNKMKVKSKWGGQYRLVWFTLIEDELTLKFNKNESITLYRVK